MSSLPRVLYFPFSIYTITVGYIKTVSQVHFITTRWLNHVGKCSVACLEQRERQEHSKFGLKADSVAYEIYANLHEAYGFYSLVSQSPVDKTGSQSPAVVETNDMKNGG